MPIAATDPWLVAAVLVALIQTLWVTAMILPASRDIGDCDWVGRKGGGLEWKKTEE
jgi:hypothetical protein